MTVNQCGKCGVMASKLNKYMLKCNRGHFTNTRPPGKKIPLGGGCTLIVYSPSNTAYRNEVNNAEIFKKNFIQNIVGWRNDKKGFANPAPDEVQSMRRSLNAKRALTRKIIQGGIL